MTRSLYAHSSVRREEPDLIAALVLLVRRYPDTLARLDELAVR